MQPSRRHTLRIAGSAALHAALAGLGLLGTSAARAGLPEAFGATTLADALRALGVAAPPVSDAIALDAPDVAENGAVVPVAVRSRLPGTDRIALLVENNPQPLAAVYEVLGGLEPEIGSRIKMADSSAVHALVRAEGRYYVTRRDIRIVLGGCVA